MPQKGSSLLWRPAGTVGCLCLRALQVLLAVATLAVMATDAGELTSGLRAWYLAPVALCQCLWSLLTALLDAQALLARRQWKYNQTSVLVTVADWVMTIAVLTAGSFSLGLANAASKYKGAEWPHGARYRSVVVLGLASFAVLFTSHFVNLINVAYHSQRH